MKNNPYILVLSIVFGISMGICFPNSKIAYILSNILRGIR